MTFDLPQHPEGPGGRPYSVEDMTHVLFFLRAAARAKDWRAGYSGRQAFVAACRIMHLDPVLTRDAIDQIEGTDGFEVIEDE